MKLDNFAEQMQQLHGEAQGFAELYPEQAQMLNLSALRDKDPYVERLLEGVAFLTGQIKQHINADLPEISGTFIQQFWPHISKPFPSTCIMQFQQNLRQVQKTTMIPRDTDIVSEPLGRENTACHFLTTEELAIQPIHLVDADIVQMTSGLRKIQLHFQVEPGIDVNSLDLSAFKFYVNADDFHVAPLLYAFCDDHNTVQLKFPDIPASRDYTLPKKSVRLANLTAETMLLPEFGREQLAFHLLHEYFSCQQKYQFVKIDNLSSISFPTLCQNFTIEFETEAQLPSRAQLGKENILLHCVPAINLYRTTAEPINLDHTTSEYDLIPSTQKPNSMVAYAINDIVATNARTGERSQLTPLYDFSHRNDVGAYFATRESMTDKGLNRLQLSFGGIDDSNTQRLSCEMLAYNGDVPRQLIKENDLVETAENISYGKFTNITRPSAVLAPPGTDDLHWQLIKYLSFNLQTFNDADKLQALLRNFDWSNKADNKKRIAGIKELTIIPAEQIVRGALRTGNEVHLLLDEENYATLGDAYVFSKILTEFFTLYADINSFMRIKINFVKGHQQWTWSSN